MMKKLIFPLMVVLLTITLGFVYKKYDTKKSETPEYQERTSNVSLAGEWLNSKEAILGLIDKIRRHPDDLKAKNQLAMAYIQESRVTGNHAYYDDASLQLANQVLQKEPNNFDALCIKATILLSQHHFSDALVVAQKVNSDNPYSAFTYGLLCDAYVELGNYSEAIKAADRMVELRPDLRSYSRVSYLREIHGSYDGAIEAMNLAVKSGVPGMEQTEWCRTQLGKLYEMKGDTASAANSYLLALSTRPDYPFALAGMARLSATKGLYTEGGAYIEEAIKGIKDPSFYDELSDLYLLQNQRVKSEEAIKKVIELLGGNHIDGANHQHSDNSPHGHYSAKELAEASLKLGDLTHAMDYATFEYNRRPDNIDINELMAWVHFKSGNNTQALTFIEKAMRTGSQKATLLWKAGNIYLKNNQEKKGTELINKALKINPFLQPMTI